MRATRTGRMINEKLKTKPRLYSALKKEWLDTTEYLSQEQRLFRRSGLPGYTRLVLTRVLRNFIFAWDDVLVFTLTAHASSTSDLPHGSGALEICPGSFSELRSFLWNIRM